MDNFDITSYEDVMEEVIKYMDYLPDDDTVRRNMLFGFITMAFNGRGGG